MIQITEPQYLHQIKKGSTVTYGKSDYRVQNDGKGFLHIIVFDPVRRKVAVNETNFAFFEPGTKGDWTFNEWWRLYEESEFISFASAELSWVGLR